MEREGGRQGKPCSDLCLDRRMWERMTKPGHLRTAAVPPSDTGDARRRGSVLVLVMAILGILFVTGMTFLTTMNFEANLLRLEENRVDQLATLDAVQNLSESLLINGFVEGPGHAGGGDSLGGLEQVDNAVVFVANTRTWAELPHVHGLFGQPEPVVDPTNGTVRFNSFTDLQQMRTGVLDIWVDDNFGYEIPVETTNDPFQAAFDSTDLWNGAVVDADGDGIFDTRLYLLSTDDGLSGDELANLAAFVNDSAAADPKTYAALKVVPHGGMANLNDSHPNLIAAAIGKTEFSNGGAMVRMQHPAIDETNGSDVREGPYPPSQEEPTLRRRSFLPPSIVPVSAVQGSPEDPEDAPPGGGDFGESLFPQGDTVRTDQHRYWQFDPTNDADFATWQTRIDPTWAGDGYDRRRLVTTISYDDQLCRGAMVQFGDPPRNVNVIDLMFEEAVRSAEEDNGCNAQNGAVDMEYLEYPHTLVSGYDSTSQALDWCGCLQQQGCREDLRRGRLRLSLPWLDNNGLTPDQNAQLIQEMFVMLLLNARDGHQGNVNEGYESWGEFDGEDWTPNWTEIELAAASLTANMIDFMDGDDEPTRVAIRNYRFRPQQPGERGIEDLGYFDLQDGLYVYGIDRQPYITEIVAHTPEDTTNGGLDTGNAAYGIELFNPYGQVIDLSKYAISVGGGLAMPFEIPNGQTIGVNSYRVILNDPNSTLGVPSSANPITANVTFQNDDTIYLLRGHAASGEWIVVDQFDVGDAGYEIGTVIAPVPGQSATWTLERSGVAEVATPPGSTDVWSPWFATVPANPENETDGTNTLGQRNALPADLGVYPVEAVLADSGSYASAFPTTGSLLLLMRHANRALSDASVEYGFQQFAFTARLRGEVTTAVGLVALEGEIDNGRMPVFDVSGLHHVDPSVWPAFVPGELKHLPWGQLVWDFFTAVPLSNPGPYRMPDALVDDGAKPRVDQEGLRVHGRINLNAAPWTVMQGLPYVPMDEVPFLYRSTFKTALGLDSLPEDAAGMLGEERAKAIAAYREMREIGDLGATTGNYGEDPNVPGTPPDGRAWRHTNPGFRRGTGFLAVGELANVRHGNADAVYRMDRGQVGSAQVEDKSYLKAIAPLACLGDWMAVRSHVFTVYGTVRGDDPEPDPNIARAKINARALRFQKTIDRLPVFMGERDPRRIGESVTGKYTDVVND